MYSKYSVLLVLLMFPLPLQAEYFRSHEWGDSMKEVIEKEGEPDTKQSDGLVYKDGQVASTDMMYAMWFGENGLEQARYVIDESHSNAAKYVYSFRNLHKALIKKYGDPNKDHIRNRDQNEYTDLGLELRSGELSFLDIWHFPDKDLRIVHLLTQSDGAIVHTITYYSIKEWKEQQQESEEETQEKL